MAIAADDATNTTQLDRAQPREPEHRASADDAIRAAAKAAIDEGDLERAGELLGLLRRRDVKPENVPPGVIDLGARRRGTR